MDMPDVPRRVGAFFGVLLLAATPLAEAAVGRTQGIASVSDGGEAQYSIPLALPPGTNGMTPALSLDYRHRSQGGLLGVGWSIGGLSQITRCPRTVAQDGIAARPQYSVADRFCLDGQRLVLVSGSVYHSANAEYRTEIESFARIRSLAGASTNGPSHFIAEAADGRIYEYGATPDSRIDRVAGPSTGGALTWALNRIRDRAGNVIDFRYTEDVVRNSFRIASVHYNANPANGIAASHDVVFVYETRPNSEVDTGYVAGLPVLQVVRLVRIDARYQGAVLRRYELAYEPALSPGGRSRLASVRECGTGGADCLSPTTFEWQDGAPGASAVAAFPMQVPQHANQLGHTWNLADFNGDGRDDYFWTNGADQASSKLSYRRSLADGTFGPQIDTSLSGARGIGRPFDANGDGCADLLMVSSTNEWRIIRGSWWGGIGAIINTGIAVAPGTRDYRGADLNGDGLGDIAWSEAADPHGNSLLVRVRYAKPSGGYGEPVTLYSQWHAMGYPNSEGGDFFGRPGRRIDLNGDGAEDLLMNENFSIARISGTGYGNDKFDVPFFGATVFDFNDDGCTDFVYKRSTAGLRVRVGHCSTNGNTTELQGPAWTGAAELNAIDWNGDGREDILVRGATNWMVALSLGNALAPLADTGVPHESATGIAIRELDGDGLDDIARATTSQMRVRFRAGPVPDLLLAATDGLGVEAKYEYRPLTDAAVHARGNAAVFPDQDLQTGDSVVSTLRVTDGTGKGYRASTGFRYEGLRRNVQGRGSLGFRKLTRTELSTPEPLSTETLYRQDFPFAGLPESVVVRQVSGKPVASTAYAWSKLNPTALASPSFPYPSKVTARRFEVGGALDGSEITRVVREVAAIDRASGFVTDETTTTTEIGGGANAGSSASLRTQHASVLNDTVNWCLGRSQAVELTASHTLPGGAPITRAAEQTWNGMRCLPTQARLMPNEPGRAVTYDYLYDAFGNIASEKITGAGMAARTVTTNWGPRGRFPASVRNPLAQATLHAWDEGMGVPVSLTDPNGEVIRWTYDGYGRLARETQPDGTGTRWTRTACKLNCNDRMKYVLRQEELDLQGAVRATADLSVDQHERGFRLATAQPGGGRSISEVDFGTRGELMTRRLPYWEGDVPPGYLSYGYDSLGRMTLERLVATGGSVERSTTIRHDGLSVTQTDGLGRSTTGTRSAWGRLNEVVDAAGGRSEYEYDAFGALLRARDALNNTVASIGYDARGFKTSVADMNLGTWTWTRNALGETTALRDAKGAVASFEYDPLGRLTKRVATDGTSTWTWGASATKNNIGRLVSSVGSGYAESFEYDSLGRPAAQTMTTDAPYRYTYTYNSLGLLDTMTYPAAGTSAPFRIRHDYDAGRVSRISNADSATETFWKLNAQDAAGHALDETLGASIHVVTGFSPVDGEMEYRQAQSAGGATIQDLAYAWDSAGNLASRSDLAQGLVESFTHDALDRLAQSRRNGVINLELQYDAIGNILRKSDVCAGTTPCYSYHATRKHAVTSAGGQAYVYDANGNMTRRGGAAIAWSSANLPVSIAHANGNNSKFSYGPDGNRWQQVAKHGTATETTVYAGSLFEKVTRGGVTTWRHYVPAPGGVALHLRTSNGAPAATRYLTLDHLGSTDRIVDAAGNVLAAESFTPFGSRRKSTWTGIPTAAELAKIAAQTRDGFTGHEHLDNLELIHMNGRVYDPRIGRFISADPYVTLPFDGQALNRYSYVLGNPLTFTDPSGFDAIPCAANQSGQCVQVVVIAVNWPSYLRAAGGAHAAEIASALERDPCGQNGNATACAMQGVSLIAPSSVVLTVGRQPDPTLSTGGRLDAVQGFAARIANLAISSSPVALLFGADPDFQYFRVPASDYGRLGSTGGNIGYFLGGAAGIIKKGGSELVTRAPSAIARSFQGRGNYLGIDRFKDITLKKGTILYAGFPGQSAFYTTASAMRRAGPSASRLFDGLQVAAHESKGRRTRMAAFEVMEDTEAAFALALANPKHGPGWLPQVVVPSYETSLRFLHDFPLGP